MSQKRIWNKKTIGFLVAMPSFELFPFSWFFLALNAGLQRNCAKKEMRGGMRDKERGDNRHKIAETKKR